jgi:beta-phosphoglucomutase-like phosphatase (HAD superfamily)
VTAKGGLQAVLFDMDGILVDTEPLWYLAEQSVMARLGGAWTPDDQRALVGGSMEVTVAYLLDKGTRPVPPAVVARWLTDTMAGLIQGSPLPVMAGARELVAQVAAAGLPYALVTSSGREIMDAVLAGFGGDGAGQGGDPRIPRFPVAVCAGDVSRCKPDPEGYLLAAARLAVDPRRCVVIEDSPNGIAAAEAAGCLVVAVPGVVPVPSAPHRLTIRTLGELSLPRLRAEFARLRPGH